MMLSMFCGHVPRGYIQFLPRVLHFSAVLIKELSSFLQVLGFKFGLYRTEVSKDDRVALLICVADSYHSLASYEWKKNGEVLVNENHPLLYITSVGMFECTVSAISQTMHRVFEVKG